MLNNLVPFFDKTAGAEIGGVVALFLNHPVVLCLVLAAVAGAAFAVILDLAADWVSRPRWTR